MQSEQKNRKHPSLFPKWLFIILYTGEVSAGHESHFWHIYISLALPLLFLLGLCLKYQEWIKSKQYLEAKEHSMRLHAIFKECKWHLSEYWEVFMRAEASLFSHIISRERNHLGTLFNVKGMFQDVETLVNHSDLTLNVCNHLLNKIWNVTA